MESEKGLDSNEEFGSGFRSNRRAFLGAHQPKPDPVTVEPDSTTSTMELTGLENGVFVDSLSGDPNVAPIKLFDIPTKLFLNSEETTSEDIPDTLYDNLTTLAPGDDITGGQTAAQVGTTTVTDLQGVGNEDSTALVTLTSGFDMETTEKSIDETTEKDTETMEQDNKTTEQDIKTTEQDTEMTEQDTETAEQVNRMVEQNTEMTEQNTEMTEQNTEMTEQYTEMTEQNTEMTEQDTETTEQDTEMAEQNTEVTEHVAETTEQDTETTEQSTETTEQEQITANTADEQTATADDFVNFVEEESEESTKGSTTESQIELTTQKQKSDKGSKNRRLVKKVRRKQRTVVKTTRVKTEQSGSSDENINLVSREDEETTTPQRVDDTTPENIDSNEFINDSNEHDPTTASTNIAKDGNEKKSQDTDDEKDFDAYYSEEYKNAGDGYDYNEGK